MKKNLLSPESKSYQLSQQKPLRFLIALLLVFVFGVTTKTAAQTCIGPYQGFESCRRAASSPFGSLMTGWSFSATAVPANAIASARTGISFINLPTTGQYVITPLLVSPDKFQFYYRSSSATNNVTFRVEYSIDNTFPDTVAAPTILGPIFTTSGTSYTPTGLIDLSAYTNIYVRVRSIATTPMTGASTAIAGTFTALGGTAVAINSDDAISGAIPIGFNFAYNGTIYSNVYASSNGFLSFNSSATSSPTNSLSAPAASLLPLVAPLWDDLDGTSGTASYSTTGTPGNRIFTFEWLNWEWGAAANTAVISFQVKLYESNGKVEFIYRPEAGAVNTASGGASVGITGNTSGIYRSLSDLGTAPTASTTAEISNITVKPATGQTYSFAGPSAALLVDDFSWTSTTTSQNNIIVPELGNTTCGSVTPIYVPNVASGNTYNFYDQGGSSDIYNKSQTQTLYFAPTTAGEKVQLTLASLGLDALTPTGTVATTITIYSGTTLTAPNIIGTLTNASIASGQIYTSTDSLGYITVVFTTYNGTSTSLSTTYPGFQFNVNCVLPPIVSSLSSPSGCDGFSFVINGNYFTGATAASVKLGGSAGTAVTSAVVSGGGTILTVVPANGSSGQIYISTPGGNVTSGLTYTSNALPSISAQPSSGTQTLCVGGSATALSVTAAAGSGSISKYEWYSNTSASTAGATLVATNTTAATTNSYTPLTASAGTLYYYVVVTNTNGCAVTSSFSGAIIVNAPVSITASPSTSPQTVCVGGSITALSVTATGGGLAYQWYSNTVSSNSGGTIIGGATSSSYTPSNASNMAATYYYCVVSNGAPCSSSATSAVSGAITVNSPTIVTVSGAGTYCNSTTLTAANGGSGTIYWQNTTSGGTSTATPSTSQLVTVSGTYYFRAYNGSCWGTEGSATVTINTPPSAPVPSAGSGATTSSINANWVASATATGYFIDVATANTFGASIVSGYNNLSVGNVLTYTVTGLSSGTTYYYRVRASNACGTSSTFGVQTYATLSLTYCTPAAPSTTTSFVNNFSTSGGITNISNLGTGFTAGGYANYTAQSCSQYPSSSVSYSITSVRTDSTDQTFFYYIWVDWNNDGDFLDAGETQLATTTYQGGPFTGSFAVPAAEAAGSYRMRVSTSWVGANTSCAINASGRGEFEDYTFTVVAVPPCTTSTPSALTSSSISGTTAVISWTDAALTPNSIYDYYYSTSNTAPLVGTTPSGTVTGTNLASLSGLTLGNTYYFWVRSNCGSPAAWAGSSNFTTVNVDIINMTNGSITTCNGRFFDSGGSVSSYLNNETYTYTIYPSAGSKLKVVFNSFTTEDNYDGLLIYNGNSTGAPLLSSGLGVGFNATTCPAGSYRGSTSPGTIVSTAADGSLTFKWTSDGSVTYSGWDANVTCVTVPVITSFTPTSTCSGTTPMVTLTGSNFTGATSVLFNGVSAAYTVVSATSITATLPASATTGYISVANAQATGISTTLFSVNPTPAVPSAGSNATICNGGSTTLSGSATGVVNTVLSQNFNAGPWPAGWSRTSNGGYSPGDFRTSSEFVSGGNTWPGNGYTGYCSYFYSYLITGGTSGDMITPTMDLSTYTSSSLTFWIYNSAGTDALNVYANNNGGAYGLIGTYGTYGSWTQITISLNAYTGTGFTAVRLKFTGTSDGGSSNIGVDDIAVNGTITATYLWSPSTGLSATNILTPVASPTSTTNYTLTTSFPSGCSASSTPITITVNAKPTVTITTAPATVCGNSVIPVNVTGTAATYTWTSTGGASTLYSDTTASTLYVAGTNTSVVYVKTPSTVTITATGTSAAGCTDFSTVVFTVTTKIYTGGGLWNPAGPPVGTESLVLNSAWTGGNLTGCSCTVNAGASVFSSGQTLTLTNGLTVAGGSLTFNNGASLLQTNNVANTGNVTYIRDTTSLLKFDYTYWSTPVSPQTIVGFTPSSPLVYSYNAAGPNWASVPTSTSMTVAKGYAVRAPSNYQVVGPPAPFTANFVGVPNNGTYTAAVTSGNFNLIGNPYPSALSADIFLNASNNPDLDGTIYLWTHNTPISVAYQYTGSDYALYNFSGGVGTGTATTSTYPGIAVGVVPNGYIAAGQGFMIKGLSNGNATFTNAMRVASGSGSMGPNIQFFKANNPVNSSETVVEKNRVWLDKTNSEGAYKQVLIGYIQDATNGLDRGFDGEMVDIGNVITLYTKVDTKKLSIQGRGLPFDAADMIPLGYKSTITGTYTITLSDFDGLFTTQNVYIEDTVTGEIHDMKASAYSFTTTSGTFEDRFILRFTTTALGITHFNANSVVVYHNALGLHITTGNVVMKNVKLFDIAGRLIASRDNIGASETVFTNLPSTQQVLLVQITTETGEKVTKKVVF